MLIEDTEDCLVIADDATTIEFAIDDGVVEIQSIRVLGTELVYRLKIEDEVELRTQLKKLAEEERTERELYARMGAVE